MQMLFLFGLNLDDRLVRVVLRKRLRYLFAFPNHSRERPIRVAVLICLFLLAGLLYGIIPPMLEKPDEDGHYGYILYLREHHSLPPLMFQPGWASEYKQPPLYYTIVAALTSWLPDETDPDRLLVINPYADHSVPGHRNDNRNVFLHPPRMSPLFLGARIVSLGFGLGVVLLTYHLVRVLLPSRPNLAIAAAAIVGFQPQFLYIATAVNNDIGLTFFSTTTIFLLAYRIQRLDANFPIPLLGITLGCAVLTKVSGLLLVLLVLIVLMVAEWGKWKQLAQAGVVILVIAFLVGGWWYIRNGILYGDPLTTQVHITGYTARFRVFSDIWKYDLPSIERTFWANLSRLFVSPITVDKVLIWWGRISLGIGGIALLQNRRWLKAPLVLMLIGWPAAYLLALLVYWTGRASWAYGRLLLPSITPIALLFAVGWEWTCNRLRCRWLFPCMVGILMTSGAMIPLVSLYPLYHPSQPWQSAEPPRHSGITYVSSLTGQPIARLVEVRSLQPYAQPGTYVPIEICWDPLGHTSVPLPVVIHLLDVSPIFTGNPPVLYGNRETYPGLGSAPTDRWMLRAPFCDRVLVWMDPETPAPLCANIEIRFIESRGGEKLQALDMMGNTLDLPISGRIPVLRGTIPLILNEPLYVIDQRIGLNQMQISSTEGSVVITMTWQALQSIPYDVTVFVHLLDAGGNILAQKDRQPLDGRFPTGCWLRGQIVTDTVSLSFRASGESGPLRLALGMYIWPSLERLEVMDISGKSLPERAISVELPISSQHVIEEKERGDGHSSPK